MSNQPVKLILEYDIPDQAQETYYRFVTGEFVPQVNRLGFELAEVWETVYGEYPRRMIVFVVQDQSACTEALAGERYQRLEKKLLRFVENFNRRIVPYQAHFQF